MKNGNPAKEIGTDQHAPRFPAGENHDGQRDPAGTGGDAVHPLRHAHQTDIGAAQTRHRAAEDDGQQADTLNLVAQGVGRIMVFAHGPQHQPRAGELQHIPDRSHDQDRAIDNPVVAEQDPAQNRNISQRAEGHFAGRWRLDAVVALTHQRRQAQPEHGQRQTRRHLIGQKNLRQKGKDQAQRSTTRCPADKAHDRAAGANGGDEAADRAHDHHAFDAKVQHAGLFHDQFAKCGQHDRHGCHHQRSNQHDRID